MTGIYIDKDLDEDKEYKFKVKAYTRYDSPLNCTNLSAETGWSRPIYLKDHTVTIVVSVSLSIIIIALVAGGVRAWYLKR